MSAIPIGMNAGLISLLLMFSAFLGFCIFQMRHAERLEELKVHRMDAAWMADDPRLLAEWRRANGEINQDTVRAAVWRRSR